MHFTASLLVIPAMLSQAELAAAVPESRGTHFSVNRRMGSGLGTMARSGYSCATELVTCLVAEHGYGGRLAHSIVATMIRQARAAAQGL